MKTVILKIGGMACAHCKAAVEDALKKIDGVANAEADIDNKQATVLCGDGVDESTLNAAVENAGFDIL